MKHLRILWLACALGALAACQSKSAFFGPGTEASSAPSSPVLATVNGRPITRSFYEFYIKGITGKTSADLTSEQRTIALDNLIRAEVVSQHAVNQGIAQQPRTAALLKLTRINVLQQAVANKYFTSKPPTDEQLQAEYQAEVAQMPNTEYHAEHILVKTEPEAEKVIASLKHGAKFSELARQDSIDSSKSNGGDLGWFTLDHMVKPFADAVAQLKPGEYTETPVHTQYGWHVIKLLGTRAMKPPTFDQVKNRMQQVVEAKEFRSYTDELLGKAKVVTYFDPKTNTKTSSGQSGALPLPAPPAAPANSAPATSGSG
jgi:peptidyl-prolyl cis-trans isomerase C